MFPVFAKRILYVLAGGFLLLAGSPLSPAADHATAKGGSLTSRTSDGRKHFTLAADGIWQLNVTERFDASALAFHNGKLITVNDRDGALYELRLQTNSITELTRLALFPRAVLSRIAPKKASRYDIEGITVDPAGNLYVSEESQRIVFKSSPDGKNLEVLTFDWSPVKKFLSADPNASLEGIAIAGDRLYLANERSTPRIIVIDLPTRKLVDSFFVDSAGFAFGGPHYSDLTVADGHLFILNRNHRCIFEVDPQTKRVLAEYSFAQMELREEVAYQSDYPTGAMEGLAIDRENFWLVTDNNGKARFKYPRDIRPTLFRAKRPQTPAPPPK
ncbi:MAG: DUF6929 family protein [Limisphaerales bacterium]